MITHQYSIWEKRILIRSKVFHFHSDSDSDELSAVLSI